MSDGAGVTAEARRRNLNNQEGGGEKREIPKRADEMS